MKRIFELCILLGSASYVIPAVTEIRNCKAPVMCDGKPGWADLESLNKKCKQEKCEKNKEIEKLIDQVLRLQKQSDKLQSEIEDLKTTTTTAPTTIALDYSASRVVTTPEVTSAAMVSEAANMTVAGTCGVEDGGKCFWAALNASGTTDLDSGKEICAKSGGIPAGIYSNELMDKLHSYLVVFRNKKNKSAYDFAVWTGLTVNATNSSIWHQPNGSLAPALRRSMDDRCQLGKFVVFSIKTSAKDSGVDDGKKVCTIFGVLCEKNKGT